MSQINGSSSPRISFSMDRLHELDQPSTQSLKQVSTTQTASASIASSPSSSKSSALESVLGEGSFRAMTGYSPSLRSKLSHWVADVRNYFRGSNAVSRGGDSFGFAKVEKLANEVREIEGNLRALGDTKPSPAELKQYQTAVREFRGALQSYVESKPTKLKNRDEILPKLNESVKKLGIEIGRATAGMKESAIERVGVAESLGSLTPLGSGQIATVSKGAFSGIEGEGVFKPEIDFSLKDADRRPIHTEPIALSAIGVPAESSNLTGRAVASSVVNDLLQLELVGKTQFAIHDGEFGFVTELAKGKSPQGESVEIPGKESSHKCNLFDFEEPELAAKLTDLHLFDFLTGQVDRHWGNVFIEHSQETGEWHVTAIDNDISFGSKNDFELTEYQKKHPGAFRGGIHNHASFLPPELPPVVPSETATKFLKLSEQALRASLDGLLTSDEISAAVERLQKIHEHLQTVGTNKQLDRSSWQQRDFSQELTTKNSYVGKFREGIERKYNDEATSGVQLVFDLEGNHVKRPATTVASPAPNSPSAIVGSESTQEKSSQSIASPAKDTQPITTQSDAPTLDVEPSGKRSLSFSDLDSDKLVANLEEMIREDGTNS